MVLLVAGVLLTALAFGVLAHALSIPRLQAARRLADIEAYGYPASEQAEEAPRGIAAGISRLAVRLGTAAAPRLADSEQDMRDLLVSAGAYRIDPETFLGYRILAAVALPAAWLWLTSVGHLPAIALVLGLPVAGILGWRIPLVAMTRRAEDRLGEIDRELPELIDSLVVTVEAGLGFSAALRMAAKELHGPLGEEIALSLREQEMGLSSDEALENLAQRADTVPMRAFVRAVVQGEKLGVSIGDIMRSLAIEARARRRSAAEERAHKAPVKLLFPLVLLIFPAIMIVLLYPAVHNILHALGSS